MGTIQEARHKMVEFPVELPRDKTVEFPQKVPQRLNRGISTETKPWKFLWNFHRMRCSVDIWAGDATKRYLGIPREVPRFWFSGIYSMGNSTVLPLWKFHGKFHRFVSGFLDAASIWVHNVRVKHVISGQCTDKLISHTKQTMRCERFICSTVYTSCVSFIVCIGIRNCWNDVQHGRISRLHSSCYYAL